MADKLPIRRVFTGDRALDEAQRTAQDVAQRVNRQPFATGLLLDTETGQPKGTGLAFTSGTARSVIHGLGRRAIGFLEVYAADVPSAAVVGLRPTAHPAGVSSTTHVTVTPTNTGTCFLLVF